MDFTELASQTPAVAAILILVAWFLKAMKSRDCLFREITNHCEGVRKEETEARRENTRMLGQTIEVIREATHLLRKMNGKP